jgi:tetratricopeptide (TPR) repeat protein
VRRNRAAVAIGLSIAAVLIVATTFSVKQMREARLQRDAAIQASKRADAQAEFASLLMSQVGDRPMTVREILDRARDGIEHQYIGDTTFLTSAFLQLSTQYSELGDSKVRATLLARAESMAVASRDPVRLAQVQCNIADNLRTEGKYERAEQLLAQADSLLRRSPDPNVEAECLLMFATLETEIDKPERSAPAIQRAIAIRDSMGRRRDIFYITLLDVLGYTLDRENRPREAVQVAQHAIALMDTIGRGKTTSTAIMRHNLGVTYSRLGEVATAESTLADVVERFRESDPTGRIPEQPLIHYAHAALYQGDADSARKYFSMLEDQAVADKNGYWHARALFGLAQADLKSGRTSEARRAVARYRPLSGLRDLANTDDQVMNVNTLDALLALAAGDTARANALVQKTLTSAGYFKGRRTPLLHSTLMLAAETELGLGRADSALALAREARKTATRDSSSATRSARVGEARLMEARAELAKGDTAAARADAEGALVALRVGAGANNARTRRAEWFLARLR